MFSSTGHSTAQFDKIIIQESKLNVFKIKWCKSMKTIINDDDDDNVL